MLINWIRNKITVQKKLHDLLLLLTDCFEEINIGEESVEIKLNKRLVFKNSESISFNSESVIILSAKKTLHFSPAKMSTISSEDLEKYNELV